MSVVSIARPKNEKGASDTMAARAYEALRRRVVSGEFRPNQRLVETDLGELLTMSRTPIREALRLLSADGLIYPERAGWVVREHTADEILHIYEARAALESHCARLAAKRASEKQLESIRLALNERNGEMDLNRNVLVSVNDTFHDGIAAAAANPVLLNLTLRSRRYYFNVRLAKLYADDELRASHEEHRQIYKALVARDADKAGAVARRHIEVAARTALKKLF